MERGQLRRHGRRQRDQRRESSLEAKAGRTERRGLPEILQRSVSVILYGRADVLDSPERGLPVSSDRDTLFPENKEQSRPATQQDPALQQPGLCHRFCGRNRSRVPHFATRRDRLARYSAQRIPFIPAKRPQCKKDIEPHHQKSCRQAGGTLQERAFSI